MEASVCYDSVTGKVAFMEAPLALVKALRDMAKCMHTLDADVSKPDGSPTPLRNLLKDAPELDSGVVVKSEEGVHPGDTTPNPTPVPQDFWTYSAQYVVCSKKGKFGLVSSLLVRKRPADCVHAKLCYNEPVTHVCPVHGASCFPVPVRFFPAYPGQPDIDLTRPLYRCQSTACATFSNARVWCMVCKRNRVQMNAGMMFDNLDVVPVPWYTDAPASLGSLVYSPKFQVLVPKDEFDAKRINLDGGEPVDDARTANLKLDRPVYVCTACSSFFSNCPNDFCVVCAARRPPPKSDTTDVNPDPYPNKASGVCTVVTAPCKVHSWLSAAPSESSPPKPVTAGKGKGERKGADMCVVSDSLEVHPPGVMTSAELHKAASLLGMESLKTKRVSITRDEVLTMAQAASSGSTKAVLTQVLKNRL